MPVLLRMVDRRRLFLGGEEFILDGLQLLAQHALEGGMDDGHGVARVFARFANRAANSRSTGTSFGPIIAVPDV
jgi:hypothetical protein